MAQGKFKNKKLPAGISNNKKNASKNNLGFTRRSNAPIQAKKNKFTEQQKIKQTISKVVNKQAEEELRSRAVDGTAKQNLTKVQQAVAKQNNPAVSASSSVKAPLID